MNTCGTCKYFGDLYEIEQYDEDFNDLPPRKYHFCTLLQHLNEDRKLPQQVAGVIDGSGYSATMCVTEEFGCNQWAVPETEAKHGK